VDEVPATLVDQRAVEARSLRSTKDRSAVSRDVANDGPSARIKILRRNETELRLGTVVQVYPGNTGVTYTEIRPLST
jgi:hypothetical protein